MNVQNTAETLRKLRLEGMAQAYESVLATPLQQQPAAHELVAQLAQAESQHRHQRKSQLYLTLSKLRFDAILPEIRCAEERNLSKDQIAILIDCSFIRNPQNILITGATGCGKSYLACALGRQACQFGFKTLYLNINRFIEKIESAKLDGSYIKVLNQIEKIPLIILDDFGLQPLSTTVRLAMLQILEDRYAKKPIIITSQLPVAAWHQYIGEPTLADAILDRITANAHRIELKGESLRMHKP
jgi:DNA replication protein DnaC